MDILNFNEAIESFNVYICISVLIGYIIVDILYAYYTLAVNNYKPIQASFTSIALHIILIGGVVTYIENILYVIPMLIGSFIGTYIVVSYHKKKHENKIT